MTLTDLQRDKIREARRGAREYIALIVEAVNVPETVLNIQDRFDPVDSYMQAVNVVNHSKAVALGHARDLVTFLEGLPDIS